MGETIEIEGLEYAVVHTKSGHCDNCAFYVFNEELQRLNPCPRPARQLCIPKGCIFINNMDYNIKKKNIIIEW